jgi:hypothetical protein
VKSKYGRSAQFRPNMTILVQFRPHLTVLVPNFCFFWKVKFFPNMMTDPTNYVSPGPRSLVRQPLGAFVSSFLSDLRRGGTGSRYSCDSSVRVRSIPGHLVCRRTGRGAVPTMQDDQYGFQGTNKRVLTMASSPWSEAFFRVF